jgi:phage terminase large subunit-like protein
MDLKEIREAAEADLETFIRLVAPYQVLGALHQEWCRWATSQATNNHQLTLLPRDHGKSRMIAFKVAWRITRQPEVRILYISATSNLAQKQLHLIKQILESPIYRRYWPDMLKSNENDRELWTKSEISVDHPKRKAEAIRDPTVFTGGLTTGLTGMHCDVAVLDDVVVPENAYTEEGREQVNRQYSLLSSIEGSDMEEWVCGTRYHPKDLYAQMLDMKHEVYTDTGDVEDYEQVYSIFERKVEDIGDGTGQFLWPRQMRSDGKWFGFDAKILAKKRAKYIDRTQFRAQYYNDPNSGDGIGINRDKFQYYSEKHLVFNAGSWFLNDRKLNLYASVDFATSTGNRSDYTAIVVIGIDRDRNIYVLEVSRFKTDKISDYYKHILELHTKWGFRKLGAEVTAFQKAIVNDLRDSYFRPNGLYISIEELKHTKHQGSKEERINAILEPRYDNLSVWHYKGGTCQTLEDELVQQHPPHDDCKDALAAAVSIAIPPMGIVGRDRSTSHDNVLYNSRFGGVSF